MVKKHTVNWSAAGVIVAITIGLAGIYLSFQELNSVKISLQQSQASLEILANKEGVYLEPSIGIEAKMYKNTQLGLPKLFIYNNGKVEAINVAVQVIRRQFDGEKFGGMAWGSGPGGSYVFDRINTYESKEIVFPEEYIVNPDHNIRPPICLYAARCVAGPLPIDLPTVIIFLIFTFLYFTK